MRKAFVLACLAVALCVGRVLMLVIVIGLDEKTEQQTSNAQRRTSNVEFRGRLERDEWISPSPHLRKSAKSVDDYLPTAAITLSSIAMGVGNAVTSIVVRVGFG